MESKSAPSSPRYSKSSWEFVLPRKKDSFNSIDDNDRPKFIGLEKTNEKKLLPVFHFEKGFPQHDDNNTRLDGKLSIARSRSVSPRDYNNSIDKRYTDEFARSLSSEELRLSSSEGEAELESEFMYPDSPNSEGNLTPTEDRVLGRPRATINFAGNEPPPIILDRERRSSSWVNFKREERLKNLRKYSSSLPTIQVSSSPPSPLEDTKKSTQTSWTKRITKVWNTISSREESPKEIIEIFKGNNLNVEHLQIVRDKLDKTVNYKWVSKLIEEEIILYIMKWLSEEKETTFEEIFKRRELLLCCRFILSKKLPLKTILFAREVEHNLLHFVIFHLQIKELQEVVIGILELTAGYPNGYTYVLDCLENYQTVHKKRSKFEEIVKILERDEIKIIVRIFGLLNQIMNTIEELQQRVELHNDLLSLGLLPILLKLRKFEKETELQLQLDIFEETMSDDHNEAANESPQYQTQEAATIPATVNPNRLKISVNLTNLTFSCVFLYNETTKVSDIMVQIKHKFPTTDFTDYGLVFGETSWLDEDRTLMECGLEGAEVLEFKMNPWVLPITDAATGKEIKLKFDPSNSCAELVVNLIRKFNAKSEEEYGIYVVYKDGSEKGEWLEDTKNLTIYKSLKDKVTILFKLKPKLVTIKYSDNSSESILIDVDNLTSKVLDNILVKRQIPDYLWDDYVLLLDENEKSIVLEFNKKLIEYQITEGTVLRLVIQERPLNIIMPNKQILKINVPWTCRISDIVINICEKSDIDGSLYFLQRSLTDSSKGSLFPWLSLKENQVPYDTTLQLSKKREQDIKGDSNIWDEVDKVDNKKGAYSLNDLVIQLSTEKDYDVSFLKTFLWTFESFTTPEMLTKKLMERFRVPPEIPDNERKLIQMRVCTVLKHWLDMQYDDLGDVMATIVNFVETEMTQKELEGIVGRLKKAFSTKKSADSQRYHFLDKPPDPILPVSLSNSSTMENIDIFSIDTLEIARQLTLPIFEVYSLIKPSELFHQAWLNPKHQHKSPNVLKLIDNFNFIAKWVSSSIVSEPKVKNRAKIFTQHIKLAQSFFQLQNYHLLVAVISGLNNSAVLRLKWTKAKINKRYEQIYTELEQLCSMESSWKSLRNAISSAIPPRIPYLGIYLGDLLFIDEGNPDFIDGNLINFEKRKLVFSILSKIEESQKIGYNFTPVPTLAKLLETLPQKDEKELYKLSLQCEPRNSTKKDIS